MARIPDRERGKGSRKLRFFAPAELTSLTATDREGFYYFLCKPGTSQTHSADSGFRRKMTFWKIFQPVRSGFQRAFFFLKKSARTG